MTKSSDKHHAAHMLHPANAAGYLDSSSAPANATASWPSDLTSLSTGSGQPHELHRHCADVISVADPHRESQTGPLGDRATNSGIRLAVTMGNVEDASRPSNRHDVQGSYENRLKGSGEGLQGSNEDNIAGQPESSSAAHDASLRLRTQMQQLSELSELMFQRLHLTNPQDADLQLPADMHEASAHNSSGAESVSNTHSHGGAMPGHGEPEYMNTEDLQGLSAKAERISDSDRCSGVTPGLDEPAYGEPDALHSPDRTKQQGQDGFSQGLGSELHEEASQQHPGEYNSCCWNDLTMCCDALDTHLTLLFHAVRCVCWILTVLLQRCELVAY